MTLISRSLIGTPEQPRMVFRRAYAVPADDLRDALTDLDRLARWFGTIEGDPSTVGDAFTARLSDDRLDIAEGRVMTCEAATISVTWSWQGEPESVITATITPVDDDSSTLTLHHQLAEVAHVAGYGGGWEQMLRALSGALGDPTPPTTDPEIEATGAAIWRTIEQHPLQLSHRVAAPVEQVWQRFASAEGMRTWWWRHWSDVTFDLDVREGGNYRIEAPGVGIVLDGTYLVVEPRSRLAFTWRWTDADGTSSDEAADLTFTPDGEGTLITVRHTGPWQDDAPADSYRQGWQFTLGELSSTIEG